MKNCPKNGSRVKLSQEFYEQIHLHPDRPEAARILKDSVGIVISQAPPSEGYAKPHVTVKWLLVLKTELPPSFRGDIWSITFLDCVPVEMLNNRFEDIIE